MRFIVLVICLFVGFACSEDKGTSNADAVIESVTVDAKPFGEEVPLKRPKAASVAMNGDLYVVDDGYEQPILRFSPSGQLLDSFGIRGGGPGQLGSVRDIIAPSRYSDSTYIIEFDKKSVLVYHDGDFIRQYKLPGGRALR